MSGEVSGNDDIYSELMDEISSDDIQNTIDNILGSETFDFEGYIGKIINSGHGLFTDDFCKGITDGIVSNFNNEKAMYINIIFIAVSGALITNF